MVFQRHLLSLRAAECVVAQAQRLDSLSAHERWLLKRWFETRSQTQVGEECGYIQTTVSRATRIALRRLSQHGTSVSDRSRKKAIVPALRRFESSKEELLGAAENFIKERPLRKRSPEPVSSPKVGVLVQLLRSRGPMTREGLLEVLSPMLGSARAVKQLWLEARNKNVFRRQVGEYHSGDTYYVLLLPAATRISAAFELDWVKALKPFTETYETFTTEDAMMHLGIAPAYTKLVDDNRAPVQDILRDLGFKQGADHRWIKAGPKTRVTPDQADQVVLAEINTLKTARATDISKRLSLGPAAVRGALGRLVASKKVLKISEGSNAVYFANS